MTFTWTAAHPIDPDALLDLLSDPSFVARYAERVGSVPYDIKVQRASERTTVELRLTRRTDDLPCLVRRAVGDGVRVEYVRFWEPDGVGGYLGRMEVRGRAKGLSGRLHGPLRILGGAGRSIVDVDGRLEFDVPIRGPLLGAFEKVIRDVLDEETRTVRDRIAAAVA
jgi:hypothetical protein